MAVSDTFYNEIVSEVDSVLDQFGTNFTVRAQGTYDEDTLENSDGATRSVTGVIATQQVVNSIGAIISEGWTGRKSLILKASAAPAPGEEIQVDSEWFPLSKVIPIKPADVVVVYMLDVSR